MTHRAAMACRAAVLSLLLLAPAGAEAQSVNDLRYRLSTVEAELGQIRTQLRAGGGAATGGVGLAATSALDRLDRLEQEIRALTGRVEELAHQQRQIAEDAQRRFGDIEFRLTELEGGDVAALTPPPPLGGPPATSTANQPAAAVSVSERDDLDRAIEDVRQGRYDQAEQRLRQFLNTYGESPLRGEALYWLGESQLTRGAYSEAARSFLDGYNADAQGEKAARTLYRLGVTLGRLGQQRDACLTLAEVETRFPSADSALLDDVVDEATSLGCG